MKPQIMSFFRPRIMRLWLIIWLILYFLICLLGLIAPTGHLITFIKVGSIFLCFIYTLYQFPQDRLLQLALGITFIADIILAINNTSEFGVLTFYAAQLVHIYRQKPKNSDSLPLLIFIVIMAISTFTVFIINPAFVMFTLCGFYLIAIITNIILAWRWRQASPESLPAHAAFLGFILFLCCDLCTGVSYLSLNHFLPSLFYGLANFFAWFFYYPSQILVSNSGKCATMNLKKEIVL